MADGHQAKGNSLPTAGDAQFNAYQRQHDLTCLPDTRVDLLKEIYDWADGRDKRSIFWLNGLAGTGKSKIARTVARRYFERKRLGASFFFSRGGGDVGHAGKFVTTIAFQLMQIVPGLREHVCSAIAERIDIASQSLRDQWQQLILRPLSKLPKLNESGDQYPYVLLVDALDECDDDNNIRIILNLLAEAQSLKTTRLRIFLTSRPEIPIRYGFHQISDTRHQDFVLHDISPLIVDHDISIFFEHNLKPIGQEHSLDDWPNEEIIKRLVQSASGLFIWAATACRFIQDGHFADERMQDLLKGSTFIGSPEEHLNELYTTVLKRTIRPGISEREKQMMYDMYRRILGSIVVLSSPLAAVPLGKLIGIAEQKIHQVLKNLHTILDISKEKSHPIRLHHPSFRDFLLDNKRCQDPNLVVNEEQAHQLLADGCIRLMSSLLKQDICGVNAPGTLVSEVEKNRIERNISPELQYACLYWIEHAQKGGLQALKNDQIYLFLQKHLLHWLEALGWMGKIPEAVNAIISLESVIPTTQQDLLQFSNFIHDAKRFILHSRSAIEIAPLQTYCSALIFAPSTSIIRHQFGHCIPGWMRRLPRVENNWNALLQTLEGHSNLVNAVAFSSDGRTLASGSGDNTVKLWEAGSGELLQTLDGHSNWVRAVAFSSDGRTLASGSDDNTVKLWEAGSGELLKTLKSHSRYIRAVAFSPDGRMLASGSDDNTVKLWEAGSGKLLQTFEVGATVTTLSFSNDGASLQTDRGSLSITPHFSSRTFISQPSIPSSVFVSDPWILINNERMLWLPADYRNAESTVYGNFIGLGCPAGRVTVIELGL